MSWQPHFIAGAIKNETLPTGQGFFIVSAMKQVETRRRGRPRTLDREKALRTALELFWRHGYEGTSINDLTAAMGVTPPSLYAAFGSKEALYREALDLYVSSEAGSAARALAEEKSAFAGFRRMLAEAVDLFSSGEQPRGCMLATALLNCAAEHEEMRREAASHRKATIQFLRERLDRAVREGELPPDTSTDILARYFASVVQGIAIQAKDGVPASALKDVAEMALRSWPRKSS
jgi:AcrR family transcriptional regulator